MSDISDAIVWASGGTVTGVPANANPAKVINLSLGGLGACDTTMQNAVNSARSMATPHVAGTVALMLAKNPTLTPDQVEAKLKETASYRGFPLGCNECGTGILNAHWAVQSAMGTFVPPTTEGGGVTTPPSTTFTIVNEIEPNNTQAAAQNLVDLNQVNGIFSSTTDTDNFKVTVPAGRAFEVILSSTTTGDYDLYAYYNGTTLAISNGPAGNETLNLSNGLSKPIVIYLEPIYYNGPLSPYTISVRFK